MLPVQDSTTAAIKETSLSPRCVQQFSVIDFDHTNDEYKGPHEQHENASSAFADQLQQKTRDLEPYQDQTHNHQAFQKYDTDSSMRRYQETQNRDQSAIQTSNQQNENTCVGATESMSKDRDKKQLNVICKVITVILKIWKHSLAIQRIYMLALITMTPYELAFIGIYINVITTKENDQLVLITVMLTALMGPVMYFVSVWSLSTYIFESKIAIQSAMKYGLVFLVLNVAGMVVRRLIIMNPLVSIIYYGSCAFHHYFFLKNISKWGQRSVADKMHGRHSEPPVDRTKAEILATDGTPMMLVKSFYVFLLFYYISVQFFVSTAIDPKTSTFTRILIRLFVVPSIFAISEYLQAMMASGLSLEMMKFRYPQLRITSLIHIVVLRFMVANSKSNEEVALITCTSCVSEIIFRTTYMKRMYFVKKLKFMVSSYLRRMSRIVTRKKISYQIPVRDASVPSEHQANNWNPCDNGINENHSRVCWEGQETLSPFEEWRKCEEAQRIESFFNYQENQNMQNEFQAIIALAFVSYFFYPIRDYVLFETTSNIPRLLTSVSIQMTLEFLTDISCRFFTPVTLPTRQLNLKTLLIHSIQNMPILASSIFVPLSSFLKRPEDYAE